MSEKKPVLKIAEPFKIKELVKYLIELDQDADIWFARDGEWLGLIESDLCYIDEPEKDEETGLYIGI